MRHVGATLCPWQPALALDARAPPRPPRAGSTSARQARTRAPGRCMAALQLPVAIAGNGCDGVDVGPLDPGDDELGRNARSDHAFRAPSTRRRVTGATVVDESGPGRREREPPPTAFGASAHGPGAGRPAALAPRWSAADQPCLRNRHTGRLGSGRRRRTGAGGRGRDGHPPTLERRPCREGDDSVSDVCRPDEANAARRVAQRASPAGEAAPRRDPPAP